MLCRLQALSLFCGEIVSSGHPHPAFSQQFPCPLGPLSIPVCYMQLTEGLTVTLKNLRKRKAGFESMPAARPGPFYLPEPVPA